MEWNLLEKTTFWVEGVELHDADLNAIAAGVARALGLRPHEVMVVDVRPNLLVFDVTCRSVNPYAIAGKETNIMRVLSSIKGVHLRTNPKIHSEGILGFIAIDPGIVANTLARSYQLSQAVAGRVAKRAVVMASGQEVILGIIRDLNSPYIVSLLRRAGYEADYGGVLEDDARSSINRIEALLSKGIGLLVTTGGMGAEGKDCMLEVLRWFDRDAYAAPILKFNPDGKRHQREGVYVGVAETGISKLIALPGPHPEVRVACTRMIRGIAAGLPKAQLAEYIAAPIRRRWLKSHAGHV